MTFFGGRHACAISRTNTPLDIPNSRCEIGNGLFFLALFFRVNRFLAWRIHWLELRRLYTTCTVFTVKTMLFSLWTRMSSPPGTSYDAADNYFEPAMIMFKKRGKGNFKPVFSQKQQHIDQNNYRNLIYYLLNLLKMNTKNI